MEHEPSTSYIIHLVEHALKNSWSDMTARLKQSMPPSRCIGELMSVTVNLPRGSGHTTAAVYLAIKYPTTIIYVGNEQKLGFLKNIYRSFVEHDAVNPGEVEDRFRSVLALNRFRGMRDRTDFRDLIIIDEYSTVDPTQVSEIKMFHGTNTRLYVQLG